jgi:hypothetical protein
MVGGFKMGGDISYMQASSIKRKGLDRLLGWQNIWMVPTISMCLDMAQKMR